MSENGNKLPQPVVWPQTSTSGDEPTARSQWPNEEIGVAPEPGCASRSGDEGLIGRPTDPKTYEVGYGKPPARFQFQPGRSGNPKGRPPKSRNLSELLDKELSEAVVVTEGNKRRRLTKREIIIKRAVNDAMSGKPNALEKVLPGLRAARPPIQFVPDEDDEELLSKLLGKNSRSKDNES